MTSAGSFAYQQEHWHGSSLRSYHGIPGGVLGYDCNGAVIITRAIMSIVTLAAAGGGAF